MKQPICIPLWILLFHSTLSKAILSVASHNAKPFFTTSSKVMIGLPLWVSSRFVRWGFIFFIFKDEMVTELSIQIRKQQWEGGMSQKTDLVYIFLTKVVSFFIFIILALSHQPGVGLYHFAHKKATSYVPMTTYPIFLMLRALRARK